MTSQFTMMSKLIDGQFSSPGLSGIDEVFPDWIKAQSFVSVHVRSFLSDHDGLNDFSTEVLRRLLKNLDVIPVYVAGVVVPCYMFINSRLGSCCSGFVFRQSFFQFSVRHSNVKGFVFRQSVFSIFCQTLQCKGSHSVNKRVHRLFLTVSNYQVYPSVTPRFVAAFCKV